MNIPLKHPSAASATESDRKDTVVLRARMARRRLRASLRARALAGRALLATR